MSDLLFVCTANICRSPIAELLWNSMDGVAGASSAGVWARPGLVMDSFSAVQLVARGVDMEVVSAFRSRPLTPTMIERAGLVLCMEVAHVATIVAQTPAAVNKTFTVLELAEIARQHPDGSWRDLRTLRQGVRGGDVADPIGLPEAEFIGVAEQIFSALTAIAGWRGWAG